MTTIKNDINNKSIKVKVFYTLRGSKSTRLTTFTLPETEDTIPLKTCLWSICSSSPDMICRDHDLSIYTANFNESGHGPSDTRDSLIWEGHGLLTWIMDQREDIPLHGKRTQNYVEVFIELQSTLRWTKGEYFNALQSQSFEQFRSSTQSPLHPLCNCFGIEEARPVSYARQYNESSSPPLPSRLPATASVFRPEPIFPTSSSTTTTTTTDYSKRSRLTSPAPTSNFYKENHELTLPVPMSFSSTKENSVNNSRRSAFTIASLSENKHDHRYLPPSNSNSSTSSSASPPSTSYQKDDPNNAHTIPVIYTPSNKKRKKNPLLMPATDATPSSSSRSYHQKPPTPAIQTHSNGQQVNTVVRTYYEVDRDNQGAYILPVEIDSWTVVDLGTVIYERPAYHNQRYIYPANYTVRKWYRSMVDPKSDTQYTCRILENGREPKFEVTADDCPMTYSGPTPTTVWTIIVRRAFAIRNQEYGHNPVGPDFFGLRKNTIAKMIQDLPNASKCSQYVWQTFEPARFNKPGRNRRRADSTLPGSLLGGVNYGLTSSRLVHNTNLTPTQQSYRATSPEETAVHNAVAETA